MAFGVSQSTSTESEAINLPLYNLQKIMNSDSLPSDIEEELSKSEPNEYARALARDKIRRFGDAIQPHTKEGGNPHYIGYSHEAVNPELLSEWKKDVQWVNLV